MLKNAPGGDSLILKRYGHKTPPLPEVSKISGTFCLKINGCKLS